MEFRCVKFIFSQFDDPNLYDFLWEHSPVNEFGLTVECNSVSVNSKRYHSPGNPGAFDQKSCLGADFAHINCPGGGI